MNPISGQRKGSLQEFRHDQAQGRDQIRPVYAEPSLRQSSASLVHISKKCLVFSLAAGMTILNLSACQNQSSAVKPDKPAPEGTTYAASEDLDLRLLPLQADGQHRMIGEWSMPADFLRANVADPSGLAVIRVEGDSMEPDYLAGERLLVDTNKRIPSPPGVYVLWDGFGLVLKRVEILPGATPPRLRIKSINPSYAEYERPMDDVQINGRVIGKWTWK